MAAAYLPPVLAGVDAQVRPGLANRQPSGYRRLGLPDSSGDYCLLPFVHSLLLALRQVGFNALTHPESVPDDVWFALYVYGVGAARLRATAILSCHFVMS